MKFHSSYVLRASFLLALQTLSTDGAWATASLSGTYITSPASNLTDADNSVWSLSNELILKDGAVIGNPTGATQILYFNQTIYYKDTNSYWWRRLDASPWWEVLADVDDPREPSVGGAAMTFKAPGASTSYPASGAPVVDNQHHVWLINGGNVYRDGLTSGGSGHASKLLYLNGSTYNEDMLQRWWKWSGTAWISSADPRVPSINGMQASATAPIIDGRLHTWYLSAGVVYRDGAALGQLTNATAVLYLNGDMYSRDTSDNWYRWDGTSAWLAVAQDPRAESVEGTTLPFPKPIIDNQLRAWYLEDGKVYRDGLDLQLSAIKSVLYQGGKVYTSSSAGDWREWDDASSTWITVAGDPRPAPVTRTIRSNAQWGVACDGVTDDTEGVRKAFAAAKNNAFTLVVDCPSVLKIGYDITKPIFIDNGTSVQFTGSGKFTVDNLLQPAFVIANSHDINMLNWNVEYKNSLPVDPATSPGGYMSAGTLFPDPGPFIVAAKFNDRTMLNWLAANRGMVFQWLDKVNNDGTTTKVPSSSMWAGPTNASSVFYFSGDSANIRITGMKLYVAPQAGTHQFIPMAFSMSPNYKSSQTVTYLTPYSAQYVAVPHDMLFSDIDLDGSYMGWQGNVQNALVQNVISRRYGDLQDANGNYVGGVDYPNADPQKDIRKWFAPPHLFYFNFKEDSSAIDFIVKNIRVLNITDLGIRSGLARDKAGPGKKSGLANSLKIGGQDILVRNYTSQRPDGFMTPVSSNGLTITHVMAGYNSNFLNNIYSGIHYQPGSYRDMLFDDVQLEDLATAPTKEAVSSQTDSSNGGIVYRNMRVQLKDWSASADITPQTFGADNKLAIDYLIAAGNRHTLMQQTNGAKVSMTSTPASLQVGGSATLSWLSPASTTNCVKSGAWSSASTSTTGSLAVQPATVGSYVYGLTCQTADDATYLEMPLTVQP